MSSSGRLASVLIVLLALAALSGADHEAARAQDATPPTTTAALPILSAPADFSLEETSGVSRTLLEVRGRVAIVFYEDREHTPDNQELKHTLHRYVLDNDLRGQITTYGVANVTGLEGMMRDMARTAIRAIAAQYGIQILLDWDGSLQRAPFGFPSTGATIALFDRQGRMRYRVTGVHTAAQQTELFRALRQLIRAT
ncbi:MAG: hypothetical protein J0L92_15600 [Deltaproteobacteria bacterium]|nr:hypothetical protein [Deltaproteobacteria bacterium]